MTFFGFVGAFGALMLQHRRVEDQRRSTAIHEAQRREVMKARALEAAEEAREDALIHASRFTIRTFATYFLETERGKIRLGCDGVPIDASEFTEVKLIALNTLSYRKSGTSHRKSGMVARHLEHFGWNPLCRR